MNKKICDSLRAFSTKKLVRMFCVAVFALLAIVAFMGVSKAFASLPNDTISTTKQAAVKADLNANVDVTINFKIPEGGDKPMPANTKYYVYDIDQEKYTIDGSVAEGDSSTTFSVPSGSNSVFFLDAPGFATDQKPLLNITEKTSIDLNIVLGVEVIIGPAKEWAAKHDHFDVTITKQGQSVGPFNLEGVDKGLIRVPVGAKAKSSEKCDLQFEFISPSSGDTTIMDLNPIGKKCHKYYWEYSVDGAKEVEMKDGGEPLILTAQMKSVNFSHCYIDTTPLKVYSDSEAHEAFHAIYKNDGKVVLDQNLPLIDKPTYAGSFISVDENGKLNISFADVNPSDPDYISCIIDGEIYPIAKAGYHFSGWTYNGQKMTTGEKYPVKSDISVECKASYEKDVPKAQSAQTSDSMPFALIAVIAIATICSSYVLCRKSRNY